jgi:hypothetical protein
MLCSIYNLVRRALLRGDSANAEQRLKGTEPVRPERAALEEVLCSGGGFTF